MNEIYENYDNNLIEEQNFLPLMPLFLQMTSDRNNASLFVAAY